MQKLVTINGHTGYVDIENDNPYANTVPSNPRRFSLMMTITDSPDWQEGEIVMMLFSRGQITILEETP